MKKQFRKPISRFLLAVMLIQIFLPSVSYASGGPTQPEVQGFKSVGVSDLVNPSSGDFSYNIPLMDVGGYPLNISYASGGSMDQESSWVGFGWSLTPGVMNRTVRGLPDDFKGDKIEREFYLKPTNTYGGGGDLGFELIGFDTKAILSLDLSVGIGLNYNNYNGYGFELNVSPSIGTSGPAQSKLNIGLGLSASSNSGVGIQPSVSLSKKAGNLGEQSGNIGLNIGTSINSRSGLSGLNVGASYSVSKGIMKTNGEEGSRSVKAGGISTNISFANPSYTPKTEFPMMNTAFTFSATFGAEIFGTHPDVTLRGYYSGSALKETSKSDESFGYLYEEHASSTALLDLNREKDGTYSDLKPNLPLANHTYDIYSATGQGVSGSFRPYRNDVGVLHDPNVNGIGGVDGSGGIEFGAGNGAHFGANANVTINSMTSGLWEGDNKFESKIGFKSEALSKGDQSQLVTKNNQLIAQRNGSETPALAEHVYFKQAGELNVDTEGEILENWGGEDAVMVDLTSNIIGSNAKGNLIKDDRSDIGFDSDKVSRKTRLARNQVMSFITNEEYRSGAGYEDEVRSFGENDFNFSNLEYSSATVSQGNRKGHHLGEMSVLRPDGTRYIYGIPAYNNVKKEITFAIDRKNEEPNCGTGLVHYSPDDDLKAENGNGSDEFFDQTITPAYAHSFLLSGVISQDYVDLEGDGMSPDDLGSYTKFNYTRAYENFGWRTPYDKDMASYNEGLKSLDGENGDDKGNIIYGEKELWYTHSIETKTHIAEFHLSNRYDAYGVMDVNGGPDEGKAMKKIDKIVLYTREEKIKGIEDPNYTPVPLKTAHFEYNYSLCPNYPHNLGSGTDNEGGKLTLTGIYFTYSNSTKGELNRYEFNYGDNLGPSYNLKAYDRWGCYAPNTASDCGVGEDTPSQAEFPYVRQDKTQADELTSAWHLTEIKTPSGGKIQVDYESDDYAYVQNKNAMQMFFVEGVVSDPTDEDEIPSTTLFDRNDNNGKGDNYIVFKLQEPVASNVDGKKHMKDLYLKNMDQLYFKFYLNLAGNSAKEYVPGYAELDLDNCGVYDHLTDGKQQRTHGYVKLKPVGVKQKDKNGVTSPIAKAGWQYLRLNLPKIAFGQDDPDGDDVTSVLESIVSTFDQIQQFVQGFNQDLKGKGMAQTFNKDRSWIRLYNPTGKKLGGGSRVKKVQISDEWDEMGGAYRQYYGQEYEYETTEDVNGVTRAISSGVASFEPMAGNDENPFRQPIATSQETYLAPGIDSYQETPFGEDFMPSPSIIYSKVTVKNLQNNDIKRNATGRVVHEYFTARDFPTELKRTSTNVVRTNNKKLSLGNLLKITHRDHATISQGYAIILNDMHGKQKGQTVYPEGSDDPISWVKYKYATESDGTVENTRKVIHKFNDQGIIQDAEIGVDYDVAVDMREAYNSSVSGGANFSTDFFLASIIPIVLPTLFPSFAKQYTQFRSVTVTKVINQYGILEETTAFDLGSTVTTSNELYDAKTGEVLLTKTVNQYDDEVYNFTYPAYWGYDQMGMAYENVGFRAKDQKLSELNAAYFNEGDELHLRKGSTNNRVWITEVNGSIGVKDIEGNTNYTAEYDDILLVRSGKRNMQSVPIGSVTTLSNPIQTINGKQTLVFQDVLSATATEYTDDWSVFCNCSDLKPEDPTFNPYKEGAKGIWRPNKSFVYLTERTQENLNGNLNIRQDGTYKTFSPYWTMPTATNRDWYPDETNWQFTTDITEFSVYGFALENQDALGRYSSSVYGYSNTLPTGVANNSEYRDIAFDSFEDYRSTDNCSEDHFSYRDFENKVTEEEAHSGRHAIELKAGEKLGVTKLIEICED